MFYIASAILEGENMTFSKHSAVISAFGRYFVQPQRFFVESHRWLIEAQELRHRKRGDIVDANYFGTNQNL